MSVSENELDSDILNNIKGCANDAARMLGLDASQQSPEAVIEAVDSFLLKWQKGERPQLDDNDDLCLMLGSLWGEELVEALGWQWAGVTFREHDNSKAVGVFSPDRALAIYPFHFIFGCIANDAPVTVLLAYNLLKDGSRIPPLPSGGYENVMDCVHYLVPRT